MFCGAFPACLKVLSHNFGAALLKKPKNVLDRVPLKWIIIFRNMEYDMPYIFASVHLEDYYIKKTNYIRNTI